MNADQRIRGIGMTSARTRDRLVKRLREQGIIDEKVLAQVRNVPRHLFMDEAMASRAYEDTALPIGHGQTISQPYVVALMTQALLEDGKPEKVLEIGSGCGYQTAILAPLVGKLYAIERLAPLQVRARQTLASLNLLGIRMRVGDGWQGWPSQAPFDGILVAAAPEQIPEALLDQLAEGGRLIIPVGGRASQELIKITRKGSNFEKRSLGLVRFVPLVGGSEG
ncbi:MAG: protein-L-isoaspartate(D-aspartate) O-methyltransferase [Chromatiales bacterium]|nr:protein-L-isoaspartate(D-aspartate) O-methyltransferase [Chromatiales bacterium]